MGIGDGSCLGGQISPGGWKGRGCPSLFFWTWPSPASASSVIEISGEAKQPQVSHLRLLAVPCSSGMSLAEAFQLLHLGGQSPAPEGCRNL